MYTVQCSIRRVARVRVRSRDWKLARGHLSRPRTRHALSQPAGMAPPPKAAPARELRQWLKEFGTSDLLDSPLPWVSAAGRGHVTIWKFARLVEPLPTGRSETGTSLPSFQAVCSLLPIPSSAVQHRTPRPPATHHHTTITTTTRMDYSRRL